MANNELVSVEPAITVNPSPIVINNREQLESAVKSFVAKYGQDFVVTGDNLTDTKAMRAKLNKLIKLFDDNRKAAKKQYLVPLREFESVMNGYRDRITGLADPLKEKIDEVEAIQREERLTEVKADIAEMAPNYGLSATDIPIRPSWTNKTGSKKKRLEEMAADMTQLKRDRDQHATDIETIKTYADQMGIEPAGWAALLGQGVSLTDTLQQINQAAAKRDQEAKAKAEREAKQKEAQDAIDATHQVKQGGETIDTSTGEVVLQSTKLKLTGTHAQLVALRKWIDANHIKYERVDK